MHFSQATTAYLVAFIATIASCVSPRAEPLPPVSRVTSATQKLPTQKQGLKAIGGAHDITRIHLTGVYYLPPGRLPIPDWHDRLAYFLDRAAKFHAREFTNQSHVIWDIRPTPYTPATTQTPAKDANEWFWRVTGEVRKQAWRPDVKRGFPILLIFTDSNFCPGYDEWTRMCDANLCICADHPKFCAGHITGTGEERPGSSCGGSRAVYWKDENIGLGVISGDGWRVPIKGSDCVAYHEGVGHAIGLPHPEPMNDSVMGRAQYLTSINTATLDTNQKQNLGWQPAPVDTVSLFSTFSTDYAPHAPKVGQPVTITATLPLNKVSYSAKAQYQTAFGTWVTLPEPRRVADSAQTKSSQSKTVQLAWTIPAFDKPAFVSYRIFVASSLGEREQQWNLFRIRPQSEGAN